MGAVRLARYRVLDKLVAIKVMRPQIADAGSFRDRFLREGNHAFDLKHRNVAALHDVATLAAISSRSASSPGSS